MDIKAFIDAWWSKNPLTREFHEQFQKEVGSEAFAAKLADFYFKEFSSKSAALYDLLVTQHLKCERPALLWTNSEGKTQSHTYDDLNRAALFFANRWGHLGVAAGDRLALAMPLNFNGLAALLAAIRLGLCIGYFPQMTRYTSHHAENQKMRAFAPKWIVDPTGEMVSEGGAHLPEELGETTTGESEAHKYQKDEPLYDGVTFGVWWKQAIFDGLITLRLRKELCLSMPYCSPLRYEPSSQLLALLFGATVHRCEGENPEHIKEIAADILVLHPYLIEHFAGEPPLKKSPSLVVRDSLAGRGDCWLTLAYRKSWKGTALIDWICESKYGGGIFYSRRKLGEREWVLPAGEPTFSYPYVLTEDAPIGLTPLRVELRDQWLVTHVTEPLVDGQWVAVSLIEESLKGLCCDACLVVVPQRYDALAFKLVAVLVCEQGDDLEMLKTAATKSICQEVGEAFVPSEIVCTHLTPQSKEGQINRRWVKDQLLQGALEKKSNHPLYRKLHALRRLLLTTQRQLK